MKNEDFNKATYTLYSNYSHRLESWWYIKIEKFQIQEGTIKLPSAHNHNHIFGTCSAG